MAHQAGRIYGRDCWPRPRSRSARPDDELIAALLVKLFADRKLSVSPDLISFLLLRMERSFAAAQDAVARLDRAALGRTPRRSACGWRAGMLFGEEGDG